MAGRGLRRRGAPGRRGCGGTWVGIGLCSLATNFPPAPWVPVVLPGSRLPKPTLERGGGEFRGRRTPGVRAGGGEGSPGVGTRLPSGRRRDAEPALGNTGAQPRGARVPGKAPTVPSASGDSHPRAALGASAARLAPGALRARVSAQSRRGAARSPPGQRSAWRAPSPSLCQARVRSSEAPNGTYTRFVSFSSRRSDSLWRSPGRRHLGRHLGPPSRPGRRPVLPKLREASRSPRAPGARSGSSQLLAGPGGGVGGGDRAVAAAPGEPQSAPAFLLDAVYFLDLLEKYDSKCNLVPRGRQGP